MFIAATLSAQTTTVTWIGGFPDELYTTTTNWTSGALPLGDGSEILQFVDASSGDLQLNRDAAFYSVQVSSGSAGSNFSIDGSNALTIGPGGIYVQGTGDTQNGLSINPNVVLAANQEWGIGENGGSLSVSGTISGAFGLTLEGDGEIAAFMLVSGSNSFTGGVHLEGSASTLYATTGSLGTGPLLLDDNTTLSPLGSSSSFSNAVTLGSLGATQTVYLGNGGSGQSSLTLSGPVTLNDPDLTIDLNRNSTVIFTGSLNGYAPHVCLDFGSLGSNGLAILGGSISNVDRLDLEDSVYVILNGNVTSGTTQVGSLLDIGVETHGAYLGLSNSYDPAGYVAQFTGWLHATGSDANFHGTLGFDSQSGTATFNDPVDLSSFPSDFTGLGSATSAILSSSAEILPPGGANGTTYPFGGGGGKLTVASALTDGTGPRTLDESPGNAPLTLVLTGGLTYTGGTSVLGSALIFDAPLPPTGAFSLGGGGWGDAGYIGSTSNSGYSDLGTLGFRIQDFVNLVGLNGMGVVGFDQFGPTRQVTSAIDLSAAGLENIYLGSATAVKFSGVITPNAAGNYQFSGVKGGRVEVSSALTGASSSVEIGLPYAMEAYDVATGNNSVSTVILSGTNTYGQDTYLNSGILDVTNSNSLGSSVLVVGEQNANNGWAATLSPIRGSVSLDNNIQLSAAGLALNFGTPNSLTLTGVISDLAGNQGTLGILGGVTLSGSNTYSGGTYIQNTTAPITIASDTGLGTGFIRTSGSTLTFSSGTPVLAPGTDAITEFDQSAVTFAGNPVINALSMMQSAISFNGTAATINGLSGDGSSSIALANGTTLTISTQNPAGDGGGSNYDGSITGGSTSSLNVVGGDSLELKGSSTYGGGTTIGADTIVIASSSTALGNGTVTVDAGSALVLNTGIVVANPISLQAGTTGGTLAGFGTFATTSGITFSGGAGLDPGIGNLSGDPGKDTSHIPIPGTLTFGSSTPVTFGPGGLYIFSINDAAGAAGTGYGTINVLDTLNITAAGNGSQFNINIYSFDPASGLAGSALNFNAGAPYSWTLATTRGITNFNSAYFNVFSSNFQNGTGGGTFSVSETGNDLMLNFTPVPEPATWALMAFGALAVGAGAASRRRAA